MTMYGASSLCLETVQAAGCLNKIQQKVRKRQKEMIESNCTELIKKPKSRSIKCDSEYQREKKKDKVLKGKISTRGDELK